MKKKSRLTGGFDKFGQSSSAATPFSEEGMDEIFSALQEAEAEAKSLVPAQDGTLTVGRFRLTSVGIELPDEISEEEADQLGNFLVQVDDSRQWWLGDWANSYIPADANQYDTSAIYAELAERFGLESNTLKNYAYVCRNVPASIRIDALSFTHHRLVAGRDDAGELLAWAVENGASVKALREHIKAVDSPPTAKAVGYEPGEQERPAPPGTVGRIPQESAQNDDVNAFADGTPTGGISPIDADSAPRRVRMGNGVEAVVIDEKDGWLMVEMPGGSRNAVHQNDVQSIADTPESTGYDPMPDKVFPSDYLHHVVGLLVFLRGELIHDGEDVSTINNTLATIRDLHYLDTQQVANMTQAKRDRLMSEALAALSYALDQAELYAESITAKASKND